MIVSLFVCDPAPHKLTLCLLLETICRKLRSSSQLNSIRLLGHLKKFSSISRHCIASTFFNITGISYAFNASFKFLSLWLILTHSMNWSNIIITSHSSPIFIFLRKGGISINKKDKTMVLKHWNIRQKRFYYVKIY